VLRPIAQHLAAHGYRIVSTARDFSSTVALCHYLGMTPEVVPPDGSARGQAGKLAHTMLRAARLAVRLRNNPQVVFAVSHGSRSQMLASFLCRIPAVSLDDYEYSFQGFNKFVRALLIPSVIPAEVWGRDAKRVVHYPGLKEELYLAARSYQAPQEVEIPFEPDTVRVLMRPGSESAHYHSATTELLESAILDHMSRHKASVGLVIIPRNREQMARVMAECAARGLRAWTPSGVLDGPALIAQMDVVVGGGGTMTREAAVLGVPAYSFFAGQWGAVDYSLETRGRLVRVLRPEDAQRILLRKRAHEVAPVSNNTLDWVLGWLREFGERRRPAAIVVAPSGRPGQREESG
jgi:predicted glycosyltransferase